MNFLELTTTFSTPRDLLRYAVSRFNAEKLFFGHGSTNAFDEAAYLILHTLHLPLDTLDPFLDAKLLPNEIRDILERIEQRASKRIPVAYITHEAWLKGYSFYVDERVIVPRSFIAELIPEQFSPWVSNPDEITQILDLCTGSGCLAIMLADVFPNAHITAVDISKDALDVAHKNIANYNLDEQITLIESDVYENLKGKKFDLIISNPPYVNAQSIQALPKEYQQEPLLALAAGEDGMDCVRKIIAHAKEHLNEEGILIVEIGNERTYAEAAFGHLNLTWLSTSAGDDMVFLLTKEQLETITP